MKEDGSKQKETHCPLCGEEYSKTNWRTRHHILPRRFFYGVGGLYPMCRECHNELELNIPLKRQLPKGQYWTILTLFIRKKLAQTA